MNHTRRTLFTGALLLGAALATGSAAAQNERSFTQNELVTSGHQFFGSVSRGLALTIEEAVRRWGEPNGYVLGELLGLSAQEIARLEAKGIIGTQPIGMDEP